MPSKTFYHGISLDNTGQLTNARLHNVTTTEMQEIASLLDVTNEGLIVYNSTDKATYIWNGNAFVQQSSGEAMITKRIDFINDNTFYKGEASPGSLESSGSWRISLTTVGSDGDVTETWASGNADFTKVWSDRLTYNYS